MSEGSRSKERSVLGNDGGAKPLKGVSVGDVDWPGSGLNRLRDGISSSGSTWAPSASSCCNAGTTKDGWLPWVPSGYVAYEP